MSQVFKPKKKFYKPTPISQSLLRLETEEWKRQSSSSSRLRALPWQERAKTRKSLDIKVFSPSRKLQKVSVDDNKHEQSWLGTMLTA